jgi:hypothetical protein
VNCLARKEVNDVEKKKESAVPMWVLLITLAIGAIVLVRLLLFSE